MPNVFTIPASAPFAATLVKGLLAQVDLENDKLALSRATIYLPTRRAVRNFAEVFARALGGAALLPDMKPLGDVDEDDLLFDAASDDLTLPPAIAPMRRQLRLAALVREFRKHEDPLTFAQAASLAAGLAQFFDEAQTQRVDLAQLPKIVPERFAQHWQKIWKFLGLLGEAWPAILQSEGALDPAARRDMALTALARRLEKNPAQGPVIAAGSTGSIPATADLLRVIASLPEGAVVLPGLDRELDEKSWNDLDEGHPQYGMRELLRGMGVKREDVRDWQAVIAANMPREMLLRETLRPAPTTDAWRAIAERGTSAIAKGFEGLSILNAAHPGEEAASIALILREVLETPAKTAALVTPDRNLARRVAAEMRRWDIRIDDSAGVPLANTPPGTFLCLLAEAADAKFSPVSLLALLKHPLASDDETQAAFRAHARQLDMALRGPRPDPGLDGIARVLNAAIADLKMRERDTARLAAVAEWFANVASLLRPLEEAIHSTDISLSDVIARHIAVAEALAGTALWSGEAGNMAASFVAALEDAAADLPLVEASSYPVLFRALAEGPKVRPVFGRHPRLSILGPLEARLQSFDTVVLGGLNEGTWPQGAAADPWLSRPMRTALGLEQPERAIGLSAHDFAALASGPHVVLTRALKTDGSPTIASRWLQRLEQLAKGLDLHDALTPQRPFEQWVRALYDVKPKHIQRPAPKPPVALRPRNLTVTEIETWLRDPYAIYAKHVLKLRPLDPLDGEIGPLERGTAVHDALEIFLKEFRDHLPENAATRLIEIGDDVFRKEGVPRSVLAIWRPRFARAAKWFVGAERQRRADIAQIFLEIEGAREFGGVAGPFLLRCRADRVDILKTGGAAIIDYKTGKPPTDKQVRTLRPQLTLEGAILEGGGFRETGARAIDALIYIQFSGDAKMGEIHAVKDGPSLIPKAEADLTDLIALFDDAEHPYLSRIAPYRADTPGDYDHLARVREWSLTGWESEP
jgi:ATP-dependent helicase/nuclease subunit B